MMLSLRRKVDPKIGRSKKRLISSHSTSEDNISTSSTNVNNPGTNPNDPRRIASVIAQDSKTYTEADNTFTDFDTTYSTINSIFDQLKSSDPNLRLNASTELKTSLISISRDLSVEQFQRFSNTVNNKIFELIHGSTISEKIGGVLAVDTLIIFYLHAEELPNQTSRLANYLRMLIPSNDIEVMRLAASTIGKLAVPGGSITSEFVETEVRNSLEWLTSVPENNTSSKLEYRKHAALLILSALAENSPYLLYPFIDEIMENIWGALRDSKIIIRNDAAILLGKCLFVLRTRNNSHENEKWLKRLFDECRSGMNINTAESIHASLLIYREALCSENGKFLKNKVDEIFRNCIHLIDHKTDFIRSEIYKIFTLIAKFHRKFFIVRCTDSVMPNYLKILKTIRVNFINTEDRSIVLVSIGDIASEIGHNIVPYLEQILTHLRDCFRMKYRARKAFERDLFYCIGKLAASIGPALAKYLNKDLLKLMLKCPPSDYMQEVLSIIAEKMPAFQETINSTLVVSLCETLYGGKYISAGLSPSIKPFSLPEARKWRNRTFFNTQRESNDDENDTIILIQSLKILQHISKSVSLIDFTRIVIIGYIEHEEPSIREIAALATCDIFARASKEGTDIQNMSDMVAEVVSKLLSIAITDPVDSIRLKIIKNMNGNFEYQLAQPDNLRLLCTALNDEYFPIQNETIRLLGNLSIVNPSLVISLLRKTMLEYLSQLKYSHITRRKEESIILLKLLICSSPSVAKPYVDNVLEVLLTKTKDPSSSVACISIEAIGDLAYVSGQEFKRHFGILLPLIITTLQDKSNSLRKESAMKMLGQLAGASGYVIDPYLDYPELLGELMNILKTESSPNIRKETVKVIGILGALDPYKYRATEFTSSTKALTGQNTQNAPSIEIALLMKGMSPSNEEYYPRVIIIRVTKILNDPSLSTHHTAAVQAIINIFQLLGNRSVIFLDDVIPSILSVMRICPPSLLEFYFQQVCSLVLSTKKEIEPFVDEIYEIITEFFPILKLQITIISLIEAISKSIGSDFKKRLPLTLTYFLNILEHDNSNKKIVSTRILKSLVAFDTNLNEFAYAIIPTIIKMAEHSSDTLKKSAILTLGRLAKTINLSEMSSRIVQALIRILNSNQKDLTKVTMNTLCFLLLHMGNDFIVFIPIISKTLINNRIQHTIYDQLVNKLLNDEGLPLNVVFDKESESGSKDIDEDAPLLRNIPVNEESLKIVWDNSQQRTKEDWQEWLRRLSIQLLKESPSQALRACSNLVSVYYPLSRDLFNVSFASCWSELSSPYQDDLIKALNRALSSPQNPPEIYQTLLNLVEFMEHDDNPLPISAETLGRYAQRCHAFAKALHYEEVEFSKSSTTSTIESLININNQLHQTDASIGILKHAEQHHDLQLKETWYEKLLRWEDALSSYNSRIDNGDNSTEVMIGKMRSLYALGEWNQLYDLTNKKWELVTNDLRRNIAPLVAGTMWHLGHWDVIEQYIGSITPNSFEREYFESVLSLHRNNYNRATRHIATARDVLMSDMSALLNESYSRAYIVVVRLQILSELEEVIAYKKLPYNSDKREALRMTWNKRLLGVQKNVDVWYQLLRVRSLVVKPKDDIDIWVKFANLCRKSHRMGMAQTILTSLLEKDDNMGQPFTVKAPPPVVYAQLKYLWEKGSCEEALNHLVNFTSRMATDLGLNINNMVAERKIEDSLVSPQHTSEYTKLLSRCFLKQGQWRVSLEPNWSLEDSDSILGSYLLATHFDKLSYKAWHNWALANFEVISVRVSKKKDNLNDNSIQLNSMNPMKTSLLGPNTLAETTENDYPVELIHRHVVPAIKGFFHSISLSGTDSIQDALRLLTLWFKFGGIPEATQAMHEGFGLIKIGTWLEVLPQLISRIHQENIIVSRSLLSLLSNLGKAHPQELVYPLTVAIKSESLSRQKAALSILENMRMHSSTLVDQAELVSHELIRVAVLWHELWYEGLENASRQYFGENNTEKMFATLNALHDLLNKGPETLREISFLNLFGRDLNDAYKWVLKFKTTNDIVNLNQAWDIYYNVFRKISKQVPQLETLDLQNVSQNLLVAKNLELAVPGTYRIGKEVVKISHFEPVLTVISSKQRPRKFSIKGTDGKEYQYILKGHEDIRQDSLVMQLFGLVNSLLQNDPECFRRHLDIQQYPAIPLSPKSGLLGWVPNSDTFHVLIKEYRDANKIPLNIEHWVMLQMAPDYDNLTLLEKIEVFEYAMENTKGQDLADVLWLKSRSSESWLERRTTYTRSLAVMSMVGYILGLGDRHPSNLMLDRVTGKVVHIDFGDCFEAAILRDKFPEKVPFRLTRMLTNAMEVSGVEGSFRITCENIMRVLRNNKESLMAILEAFAFDPLIHWGFDISPDKIMKMTGIDLPSTNLNELLRNGSITIDEFKELEIEQENETRNARAILVLRRITDKLVGSDIEPKLQLNVPEQVDRLIHQATSIENLCQNYIGWCPFW